MIQQHVHFISRLPREQDYLPPSVVEEILRE